MGGADVVDLILGCVAVGSDEVVQTPSGTGNVPASKVSVHVALLREKMLLLTLPTCHQGTQQQMNHPWHRRRPGASQSRLSMGHPIPLRVRPQTRSSCYPIDHELLLLVLKNCH